MDDKLQHLLARAEQLISRIEAVLPQPLCAPDWNAGIAYRYRKRSSGHGALEPVRNMALIELA
ncbi:MAG: AAA family ATPase, partial [Burkholderiaceae bacterium]